MKQKTLIIFSVLALIEAIAWGQQNEREQGHRDRGRVAMAARGHWLGRRLASPEFMEKVGIQGEQATKLKAGLEEIEKQSQKIEESIEKLALEQAAIAKRVLAEPGAADDELMQKVEQIGKLRTEQAKLATKRMIVMRDNLTSAQREKVLALMNDEQKRWRDERDKNPPNNRPAGAQNNRPPAPQGW